MAIRILLADDHTIMQEGLRALLEKEPDMEVVAEAKNGREAVSLAFKFRPDVVIVDISMPGLNGMDATSRIMTEAPETRIIGLSMHSDEQFVSGMFRAGAVGYLLKDCAAEELCYAIRSVYKDGTYLSPPIASIVRDKYVRDLLELEDLDAVSLTSREREVVQLLAEGKTSKETAAHLNLSIRTIEAHRRQIMSKLGLSSVAQLTKYAIREGLTSVDY